MGKGEKLPCEELKEPKEEGGEVKSEGGGKWLRRRGLSGLVESLRLVLRRFKYVFIDLLS